jgi:uncharacterized repeat protein (TIGR04052 family)
MSRLFLATLAASACLLHGAERETMIVRFAAQVNGRPFVCGDSYEGVGTTKSKITPRDFRFYIHNLRLVDDQGQEVPFTLREDGKWQGAGTALLDFENAKGPCANGTPETNDTVVGELEAGHRWRGVRFTLGVPFPVNHQDLTTLPSPLNLTAMSWVWNVGHKFLRVDFASTGQPRGFFIHLGSTTCTPSQTKTTVPTSCAQPNRVEVSLEPFDPIHDVVIADLGRLLADTNVDVNAASTPGGCMSFPGDPDCVGIFAHFGLPYGRNPAGRQDFFAAGQSTTSTARTF